MSYLTLLLTYLLAGSLASPLIAKFTGGEHCSPGELIWVDCNLCTCNLQGKPNLICAKMWCQPQPQEKPKEASDKPEEGDLNN